MEFGITNAVVYGLHKAIKASGNPMRTEIDNGPLTEKDIKRARALGKTRGGEAHDNFLKGILVHMDVTAPFYWWKEAQRYHWFDFISSQSTMHSLMKFDIKERCVSDVDERIYPILAALVEQWKASEGDEKTAIWRRIIATLPSGFTLTSSMTTNYQQLKTMFFQRRYHKLREWREFCDFLLTLPHFEELIMG